MFAYWLFAMVKKSGVMKKFLIWAGGALEDKQGAASSKRVGFFICLFILYQAVKNPVANEIAIYTVAALAFGLAGLTMPEWFNKLNSTRPKQNPSDPQSQNHYFCFDYSPLPSYHHP